MIEWIGWIGSLMLAICALPQAWASYKQGHSDGLTWSLLILWCGGELVTLVYVFARFDWPLIINYGANTVAVACIIWYKWRPRTRNESFSPINIGD